MDYEIYLLERDGHASQADPLASATDIAAASEYVEHMVADLEDGFRIEVYGRDCSGDMTLVNRYEPPKIEGSHVMQSSGPDIRMGVYEYKGKLYNTLGVAQVHHTGEVMVAYIPLYTDDRHVGPPIHLRPVGEFLDGFQFQGSYL